MSLNASTSALEVLVWGLAATVVQLLVFRIIDQLLIGVPQRVRDGEMAAAALLAAAKLAEALIFSAAVAG